MTTATDTLTPEAELAAFMENSAKIVIYGAFADTLPLLDAALLSYVYFHCHDENSGFAVEHLGMMWMRQEYKHVSQWLGCSESTLKKAAARLRGRKLLSTSQTSPPKSTLWRTVDSNILDLFKSTNSELSRVPNRNSQECRIGTLYYKNRNKNENNESKDSLDEPVVRHGDYGLSSLENKGPLNARKGAPAKTPEPDPYVEHWNQQPHVPKCGIGTKSYEQARAFFAAHRRYAVGVEPRWFLPPEYGKEIGLAKINGETGQRRGHRPRFRPDAEIFAHIETAALAYDPGHHPQDKKYLGRSLPAFLYNQYSKRHGQASLFLQFIHEPALPLEDVETLIWERLDTEEKALVNQIEEIYLGAGGKTRALTQKEMGQAVGIATAILKRCERLDISHNPYFKGVKQFLHGWQRFCEEEVMNWPDMPITALHPSKELWRRYVDWMESEIKRPVFDDD